MKFQDSPEEVTMVTIRKSRTFRGCPAVPAAGQPWISFFSFMAEYHVLSSPLHSSTGYYYSLFPTACTSIYEYYETSTLRTDLGLASGAVRFKCTFRLSP